MIPLLPLLIDTSMTIENPDVLNIVHEWGVVVFQQESGSVYCGGAQDPIGYNPDDMCAEAPVVWIHGEPFGGQFNVYVDESQNITVMHPQPDVFHGHTAGWRITAGEPEAFEETPAVMEQSPYYGPFDWAVEYWRDVPSLPLFFPGTGQTENFIYYECTVNDDFTGKIFQWSGSGNPVFHAGVVQEALYFTPYGVFPVELNEMEFMPLDLPMAGETDPRLAPETFCRWADSMLKSSEIEALWETWKPTFAENEQYWLVFPVPGEFIGDISIIELSTDIYGDVEYHRLFLGAVKLTPAGN